MRPTFDLVIPTLGRPSLRSLLRSLDAGSGPLPARIVIVDDRRRPSAPLPLEGFERLDAVLRVVASQRAGPAAARNLGWRLASSDWVAFLDDDVIPGATWLDRLAADLSGLPPNVAGSQGRLWVPLDEDRPPTDWERNVKRLEGALWITADMAYRRSVLAAIGGFDERFRRAYREDSDLATKVISAGYSIQWGTRLTIHPLPPASRWVSVKLQAGNADDALMSSLYGRAWRKAGEPRGRLRRHLAITAAAAASVGGLTAGSLPLAVAGAGAWTFGTAEFAWARIAPGPRTIPEVVTMLATSCVLPVAAAFHWLRGSIQAAPLRVRRWRGPHKPLSVARVEAASSVNPPPLGLIPEATRAWFRWMTADDRPPERQRHADTIASSAASTAS